MTSPARFAELDATRRVLEALAIRGRHRAIGGLWGSSAALLVAAVNGALGRPMLIVTADDGEGQTLRDDLATFGFADLRLLPRQDHDIDGVPDPVSEGGRARCLSELIAHDPDRDPAWICSASLEALMQPAPAADQLGRGRVTLRADTEVDEDDLLARCREAGLREVPVVLAPGEVSRRGDVLDVHPLTAGEAYRLEFFDSRLESIRTFDPGSQRSLALREQVVLVLGGRVKDGAPTSHVLPHLFRPELVVAWYEPLRIDERRQSLQHEGGSEARAAIVQLQETLAPLTSVELSSLPSHDLDFKILSAGSAVGAGESDPLGRLSAIRGLKGDVVEIVCRTIPERDRLAEIFTHKGVDLRRQRVQLRVGALSRGFRVPELGWTVLSNTEFAGVPASTRVVERPKIPSRAVQSFFELGTGDLVVHAAHGIALFEGIQRIQRGDSEEDFLELRFRDEVLLLVPVSKIHLVQKYVGAGSGVQPKLDKLGGKGFQRRKEEVQRAMFDLASDLLDVQADRERLRRAPYPGDALEGAFLDGFPFEDTVDQRSAWSEISADLERDRPMDRLLCGDVGFGKTELAMRAAFKVAITGRQAAVLVPTTVLADQHGQTFSARFEPHGLRVEVISRFGTAKKKREVLAATKSGRVDVLIGTHRLLGRDVQFGDLGLVIIDEEQRFGVRQKEHLKKLRLGVDVLSLSATPIPRTLHTSLLGLRQISTLSTPPIGRQDVETRVAFLDDPLLQSAVRHELAREGQVFVLHDRISGLDALSERVERLVPEARVEVAHGKLTEAQLDRTLRRFIRGDADVLVSTSIVENGLDIPRANTMLVDRAEMFGLAELHQLRGRVGRSSIKASCWLLMDRLHPPPENARKRLKALEEFSHLGAGFAIAMKDLEIRGAGNLLGPQQSGHIAAVGYEMYCELLRTAVGQAKDRQTPSLPDVVEVDVDLGIAAFVPDAWVAESKARLEVVREMDGAISPARAQEIRSDLADRFGKLPAPAENLLRVFLLKHALQQHDVRGVQRTQPDRIVVRHRPEQPLGGAWLDAFTEARPVEAGKTHLMLPRRRGDLSGEQVLQLCLEALWGPGAVAKNRAGGRRRNSGKRRTRAVDG